MSLILVTAGWLSDARSQPICDGQRICPQTGDCVIAGAFELEDGCVLDFDKRNVTIADSGQLVIGSGTVRVVAGDFTIATGGLVDGRGTFGGFFTVDASGNIAVDGGSGTGKILVSGSSTGGEVRLEADGIITVGGVIKADKLTPDAAGGGITLIAGKNISVGSQSVISVQGGNQQFGGDLTFEAGGSIDIGTAIEAGGDSGGTISLKAGVNVIVRDRLVASGVNDDGGDIDIVAGTNVTLSGAVQSRGGAEADGGEVFVQALKGDVNILDVIDVEGGPPDGTGGSVEVMTGPLLSSGDIFVGGSISLKRPGMVSANGNGSESTGGDISFEADGDVMLGGHVDVSGGDAGGTIGIIGGRDVEVMSQISARSTSAAALWAGEVAIEAGRGVSGNVMIDARIDVRGGPCDGSDNCGEGGDVAITGCDVTVTEHGSLEVSAPGPGGVGGVTSVTARHRLTVSGPVNATGSGEDGRNSLAHASANEPIISVDLIKPDPEVLACGDCLGSCAGFCMNLCQCGNDTVDQFEECDGSAGCQGSGEVCGAPGSDSGCICIRTCGNGEVDPGEDCDPLNLGGLTCELLGFPGGQLGCNTDCTIDDSLCDPITCGDGVIAAEEVCEPGDLAGESCRSLGFFGGDLACGDDCLAFDVSGCTEGTCGDGFRCFNPACATGPNGNPEECDDGAANADDASCLSDCQRAACGDGLLCSDESCTTGAGGRPEECDEGAANADSARCLSNCQEASCGDGFVCSDSSCITGPGGGPEECDGGICCGSPGSGNGCDAFVCEDGQACGPPAACCHPDTSCDDGNPCTNDQCIPSSGCFHFNNSAACDDGNACTEADRCVDGVCSGTPAVVCTSTQTCVEVMCQPETGFCVDVIKADGSPCDDGNPCTTGDACGGGSCASEHPVVCTAVDQCHEAGVCDPRTGECSNPERVDGTLCDDGDACTQSDSCTRGDCIGMLPVTCMAVDQCHDAGVCEPVSGVCTSPPKVDGALCDDGDACTRSDVCMGGECLGSDPIVCAAVDQCHEAGTCDPSTGECSDSEKVDGTPCDDGNACTTDTCISGICMGAVRGFDGFNCSAGELTAPDVCGVPLPRNLRRVIPKKVAQAQKAAEKAGRLTQKGAKRRKIQQQLRRMRLALGVIERKVNSAERSTRQKKRISPACAARLRALLANPQAALGELQL